MTANDTLLADIYKKTGQVWLARRMLELHTATWWLCYFGIYVGG